MIKKLKIQKTNFPIIKKLNMDKKEVNIKNIFTIQT